MDFSQLFELPIIDKDLITQIHEQIESKTNESCLIRKVFQSETLTSITEKELLGKPFPSLSELHNDKTQQTSGTKNDAN